MLGGSIDGDTDLARWKRVKALRHMLAAFTIALQVTTDDRKTYLCEQETVPSAAEPITVKQSKVLPLSAVAETSEPTRPHTPLPSTSNAERPESLAAEPKVVGTAKPTPSSIFHLIPVPHHSVLTLSFLGSRAPHSIFAGKCLSAPAAQPAHSSVVTETKRVTQPQTANQKPRPEIQPGNSESSPAPTAEAPSLGNSRMTPRVLWTEGLATLTD
jgi:hypothetical protein